VNRARRAETWMATDCRGLGLALPRVDRAIRDAGSGGTGTWSSALASHRDVGDLPRKRAAERGIVGSCTARSVGGAAWRRRRRVPVHANHPLRRYRRRALGPARHLASLTTTDSRRACIKRAKRCAWWVQAPKGMHPIPVLFAATKGTLLRSRPRRRNKGYALACYR